MGHRNLRCSNEMIDIGMDQQGQGYLYPGPPIRVSNFHPPSARTVVAPGSNANYETHYLPERHDGALFRGSIHYAGVPQQPHHNHLPHSFYPSFMPPSAGVLPVNHHHGVAGSSTDEFGSSHQHHHHQQHFVGPCKSKVPEGVQGNNYHHFNTSATPISSVPPMRHPDGVSVPDPPSFSVTSYNVGNGNPPPIMHDHTHLARGSFGQHFQPSGGIWMEQQHMGNGSSGEGSALAWNQAPGIPFMHVPMESATIGIPRQNMRHNPPVNHRHQTHHALPLVLRPREHNGNLTASSHRSSSNSSRANRNLPHSNLEMAGHMHAGAVPPTGLRIYRPHRGHSSDAALRNPHFARLRYLHADEVAILEIPDLYEIGEYSDNHSDLRLDIEDMSYEELLALGERIGNVNTGLSEKAITEQLKIVPYLSPVVSSDLDEESSDKAHCCIICQDNYKSFEKVGVLGCGHEYHAECLKKWLIIKNVCPICKSEALSTNMEEL